MTRITRPLRIVLAVMTVALSASVLTLAGLSSSGPAAGVDTALPPGWELCILQGTNAPLTADNVAALDGWQVEEGGSTNNTAAYNPFNTGRTSDITGAPLPTVASPGFPAFANWLAGCAATVATLLQPNMATIVAGLRAGDVTPSVAFLALVDQSQWCAPSADGVPCYANALEAGGYLVGGVLTKSTAVNVYSNVDSDLHAYQLATLAVATAKTNVAAKSQKVGAAQSEVSSLRNRFDASQRALRSFAVDEYVSSGLYVSTSYANPGSTPKPFGPPSPTGVVAQQYENVATSDVLARNHDAETALRASISHRDSAAKALQQAVAQLMSDTAAENRALLRLATDVATMQTAGACTSATVIVLAPGAAPATTTTTTVPAGTARPTTTTTTTPTTTTTAPTSTTTTTTAPAPTTTTTTTTSSTTTTTTTSSTTTTTTTQPNSKPPGTTTTTAPPSRGSTASSVPTTTTTAPSTSANAPSPTPNPAGIQALQGCVSTLAPTPGATN
jgi:hypothetical protein